VQEVRDALSLGTASPSASGSSKKWWWPTGSWKGKGKARGEEFERKALRRLVRVGKGVEGDDWVKRVEPGTSLLFSRGTRS
jgi:Golgi apyrase